MSDHMKIIVKGWLPAQLEEVDCLGQHSRLVEREFAGRTRKMLRALRGIILLGAATTTKAGLTVARRTERI
jgi:hypothetical protein